MGNCCSSKREENEFDDDLNTLRPGDAKLDLNKDNNAGTSLDLDDVLDGNAEEAKKAEDPTSKMSPEQKK